MFHIESHPECNTSPRSELIEKGTTINITCSVRFKGNMVPEIEWRQSEYGSSNGGQLVTHDVTKLNSGHMISTQKIIVDFPQPRIFTFRTFFQPPTTPSPGNAAANAPDYTYTWKSLPIGPPSVVSLSSPIATSSKAVKSSRHDDDGVQSAPVSSLKLSDSTASATGTRGDSTLPFVMEHWSKLCIYFWNVNMQNTIT